MSFPENIPFEQLKQKIVNAIIELMLRTSGKYILKKHELCTLFWYNKVNSSM